MRSTLLLPCSALALLFGTVSCATGPEVAVPGSDNPAHTIAQVGPYAVTMADLEQAVRAIHGDGETAAGRSLTDLEVAIDALVAARLLVLEAERRGLDREPGFVATLDSLQAVLLREAIYDRDVYGRLPVPSEEAINRLYAEWGHGAQVRGAHILVRTEEQAEEIIRLLDGGAAFGKLARTRSSHTPSATQGGTMGFLRRGQYPPGIADLIWALPVGEYGHEPLHTPMGWHVLAVTARRTQSLAEQRLALLDQCERRARQAAEARFVDRLRDSYQVIYHAETAVAVASLIDTLSGNRRLFSWRDGKLDLADFLQRVQVPDPVSQDTARMQRLAAGLVFDELAAREAEKIGYASLPDVHKAMQDKRLKLLGESMFEVETTPAPALQQVRDFFDEKRELFRSHTVLTIREILVDEASVADSLYRLIASGHSGQELARRYSVRTDLAKLGGLWQDVRPKDPRSGRIYAAAIKHGLGLHPPLKVPGGYSVFEVLDIQPGRLLDFAEAEATARSGLASFRMEALITGLRQSHHDRISIDHAALQALAAVLRDTTTTRVGN